jgi:hypothetical protein
MRSESKQFRERVCEFVVLLMLLFEKSDGSGVGVIMKCRAAGQVGARKAPGSGGPANFQQAAECDILSLRAQQTIR